MASSNIPSPLILEQMRLSFSRIERYEDAISHLLEERPKSYKASLTSNIQIYICVSYINQLSRELLEQTSANASMNRAPISNDEVMTNFYKELNSIQSVNAAGSISSSPLDQYEAIDVSTDPVISAITKDVLNSFTEEEMVGRYLDLFDFFDSFKNLPHVKDVYSYFIGLKQSDLRNVKIDELVGKFPSLSSDFLLELLSMQFDYCYYLRNFHVLHEKVPSIVKLHRSYRRYLGTLTQHFCTFLTKTQPLLDFKEVMSRGMKKVLQGKKEEARSEEAGKDEFVDLANVSLNDLMTYSAEWLKTQLARRNLKVGGSVEQKAKRLFDAKDAPKPDLGTGQVDASVKEEANASISTSPSLTLFPIIDIVKELKGISEPTMSTALQVELLQTVLFQLHEILHSTMQNTWKRIEKFATLTPSEIASAREVERREIEAEEDKLNGLKKEGEEEEEEEEEVAIYNPLNLPLDWDGKPIPYWLWKLQGLNISYNCEICGNTSYQGRKNFDKHFHEAKHTRGLRLLGIANSKQFQDITRIEDALELAKKVGMIGA
jgi:splicing factor 3A subunit 3